MGFLWQVVERRRSVLERSCAVGRYAVTHASLVGRDTELAEGVPDFLQPVPEEHLIVAQAGVIRVVIEDFNQAHPQAIPEARLETANSVVAGQGCLVNVVFGTAVS